MGLFSSATELDLQKRQVELDKREVELKRREEVATHLEYQLAARDKEQISRETLVAQRERDVGLKEAEAKAGFARANADALQEFFDTRNAALDSRERMVKASEESLITQLKSLETIKADVAARQRDVQEREVRAEAGCADQKMEMLKVIEQESERLKAFAQTLSDRESECQARMTDLERRGADVARREREVVEREAAAEAGFHEQNKTAVAALEARLAELRAQAESLSQRLADDERSARESLEATLCEERRLRFDAIEKELAETHRRHDAARDLMASELAAAQQQLQVAQAARSDLETALAAERTRRVRDLQDEMTRLFDERAAECAAFLEKQREEARRQMDADREAFNADVARQRADCEKIAVELASRAAECERREFQAAQKEAVVDEERADIEETVNRRTHAAIKAKDVAIDGLTRSHDALLQQVKVLEAKVHNAQELLRRCGNRAPEELLSDLQRAEAEAERLNQELITRPSLDAVAVIAGLRRKEEELTSALSDERSENAELQAQKTKWVMSVGELESQKQLREAQERQCEALTLQVNALGKQLDDLMAIYGKPQETDERQAAIRAPYFKQRLEPKAMTQHENEWLAGIAEKCEHSGLRFPSRLFQAFHTAIKTAEWSPLAVLAGVSGTGKSELPRLYARFGGLNFLSVAVQPNWDSPQSLFGFFNSVDNRFNATPVLQLLAQSQRTPDKDNGLSDQVCLILLDEMNLAPIELYFSDLLSKLEERRGLGDKDLPSLEIDLGAGVPKGMVTLGRNVMWCGTMNEDETTKTLSDKVLDRGNILFFPRPKELYSRPKPQLEDPVAPLPRSVWLQWVKSAVKFQTDEIVGYRETLEKMNGYLEVAGRALGHRVWQTVEQYMGNYPDVINAAGDRTGEAFKKACDRAFEDQLVLKVMPKLRGIETSGKLREECIEPIRTLVDEKAPALSEDFALACHLGYGNFIWKSAKYIEADS